MVYVQKWYLCEPEQDKQMGANVIPGSNSVPSPQSTENFLDVPKSNHTVDPQEICLTNPDGIHYALLLGKSDSPPLSHPGGGLALA